MAHILLFSNLMKNNLLNAFWVLIAYTTINLLVSQQALAVEPQCKLYTDVSLSPDQTQYFEGSLGYSLQKVSTSTITNHETLAPLLTDSSFVLTQSRTKNKFVFFMSITRGTYNSKGWIPLEVVVQADLTKNSNLSCRSMAEYVPYNRKSRESVVYMMRHALNLKTNPEITIGQSLIQLEHHYLISRGEKAPDLEKINAKYVQILQYIKDLRIENKDVIASWPKVYQAIYSPQQFNVDYCRRDTLLISALDKRCTNCVGFASLFISLFIDSGFQPPKGWILGLELFRDHIKPVLYSKKNNKVYDLSSGEFAKPVGAIYPTSALSRPAAVGFDRLVVREEKKTLAKNGTQQVYAPLLCVTKPLDLGYHIRLQLFNWGSYKFCGRSSSDAPPEHKNLDKVAELGNRERVSGQLPAKDQAQVSDQTQASDETGSSDQAQASELTSGIQSQNSPGGGFFSGIVSWLTGSGPYSATAIDYKKKMLEQAELLSKSEQSEVERFSRESHSSFFSKYKLTDFLKKIGQESDLVSAKMQDADFSKLIEEVYFFPAPVSETRGTPPGCEVYFDSSWRIIWIYESLYPSIVNLHSLDRYALMSNYLKDSLQKSRRELTFGSKNDLPSLIPFLSNPQTTEKWKNYLKMTSCTAEFRSSLPLRLFYRNFKPLPEKLNNKIVSMLLDQDGLLEKEIETFSQKIKSIFFTNPLLVLSEIDKTSTNPQNLAAAVSFILAAGERQRHIRSILNPAEPRSENSLQQTRIEFLDSVFWHEKYYFTVAPDESERIYQNTTVLKIADLRAIESAAALPYVQLPKLPLDWCKNHTTGYVGGGSLYVDCGTRSDNSSQTKISDKKTGVAAKKNSSGAGQQDQAGLPKGTAQSTDTSVKKIDLTDQPSANKNSQNLLMDPRIEVQLKPRTFEYLYYLSAWNNVFPASIKLGLFHSYRSGLEKSFQKYFKGGIEFYVNEYSPHSVVVKSSDLLKQLKQSNHCFLPGLLKVFRLYEDEVCRKEFVKQVFQNRIKFRWTHLPAIYQQNEFTRVAFDRLLKNTNEKFQLLDGIIREGLEKEFYISQPPKSLFFWQLTLNSEKVFQVMYGNPTQAGHGDDVDWYFQSEEITQSGSENHLNKLSEIYKSEEIGMGDLYFYF